MCLQGFRSRLIRVSLGLLLGVGLVLCAALLWLFWPVLQDPVPGFMERRGELAQVRETRREVRADGALLIDLELHSSSGLVVEMSLRKPPGFRVQEQPDPGQPMLLMLGGQETGRAAVDVLPETHGVVVAALSYPFPAIPHRSALALTGVLRGIQSGILDVPPSVLLAIDYLQSRDDLPQRIELAGISFGAYLAAVPASLDQRVQRLWLIHGSGEPASVIAAGLEGRLGPRPLRHFVAWVLSTAAGAYHLGPEAWVGEVSPRPVVVISADADRALPLAAVHALHEALAPPSEVLWTRGEHVHPRRPEVIQEIVDLMFGRISRH